jgi:hypothetical protein
MEMYWEIRQHKHTEKDIIPVFISFSQQNICPEAIFCELRWNNVFLLII